MKLHWLTAAAAIAGATPALAADEAPAVPSFNDLERWHARDHGTALAQERLAARFPAGTTLATVQQAFEDAGAECSRSRKAPGELRCLIHQYSFANRMPDDVRWTIVLHGDGTTLSDLKVDRYVDRHFTG